jgi:hypothetical protein
VFICSQSLLVHFLAVVAFAQLVPFEKDNSWGYKTPQGRVVIEPRYQMAERFSNGIAAVCCDGGWAYIDPRGRVVIRPFVFDNGPDYFHEGVARYTADGKFGFFDRRGKVVIGARFDYAGPFSQGRAIVCEGCRAVQVGEHSLMKGGKWGFIGRTGEMVIPLRFDAALDFEKGKARVQVGGAWKDIDRAGRILGK